MALATTILGSLVERNRDAIVALAKQHKGLTVAVFGSVARGEDAPSSDIDFLVEFERGSSLFDVIRLQDGLRELPGCKVDVVSSGALLDRDNAIRRDAIAL